MLPSLEAVEALWESMTTAEATRVSALLTLSRRALERGDHTRARQLSAHVTDRTLQKNQARNWTRYCLVVRK